MFLFDEPLSNLDAELRVQMRLELAKLHRDLGATMIYVTHDQVEAMTLADRIVVLRDGASSRSARPMEIYDAPVNRFVAGFIGSPKMSFLRARVREIHRRPRRAGHRRAVRRALAARSRRKRELAGEVAVGVRPEHFLPHEPAGPRLVADIEFVERLGGETYLHAPRHPAGPLVIKKGEGTTASKGEAREITVDWVKAHLFAADGG